MSVLLRKLDTLTHLTPVQIAWLLPLYILSAGIRLAILTLPFRWIAPFLGHYTQNTEMTPLISEQQQQLARQLGTTIKIVSRYTPWESACLVQALLARFALSWHRIPHIAYLGVNKPQATDQALAAHAWVSAGQCFVTGGNGHQSFTVVSSFTGHVH